MAEDQEGARGIMAREKLAMRPDLTAYEMIFYGAFNDISTERQSGMAMGPIPSSAIAAYTNRHDLTRLQGDQLYLIVRAMDAAFTAAVAKKQKAA